MWKFRSGRRKRRKFWIGCMTVLGLFSWLWLRDAIPDTMSVLRGKEITLQEGLPVTVGIRAEDGAVSSSGHVGNGSYEATCKLFGIIPVKKVTVHIVEESQVIPCGVPLGIYLQTDGVLVVDTTDLIQNGIAVESPAGHILKAGDYIMAVNGTAVCQKEKLQQCIAQSKGAMLRLSIVREGEAMDCELQPVRSDSGAWQLGIWVRDDMAGIGTLTFIDGEGNFGALGHGITDIDVDRLVTMSAGKVYPAEILDIIPGKKGTPGELVGQIFYEKENEIGEITENTKIGIFGSMNGLPEELQAVRPMTVGLKQEISTGPAQILATLGEERQLYEIEITGVDLNPQEMNKGISFRVTDETMLEQTGGIIQGLSGAPILQNGKIIGAVTHVFVNDPTKGYGIFIETMLDY